MSAYTLGLDYGTNSVRAVVVDATNGRMLASHVFPYPSGEAGIVIDSRDPHVARQHPGDYLSGLEESIAGALAVAEAHPGFARDAVRGIGIASTGSTPLPIDSDAHPLALDPRWADHPAAQAWLWKDHTASAEAQAITRLAAEHRPQYLAKCGGIYSSEWWWAKLWRCLKDAPDVFAAADSWVELCDFVPAVLSGIREPRAIRRGVCAAGHKAIYSAEWGGLPDEDFLSRLDPALASLRDRLYDTAIDASSTAGNLCDEWAQRLSLPVGIPIAIGAFDAHYGAIGAGVTPGTLVKIIGTSTCDCTVHPMTRTLADVPGICGVVPGSILPDAYGLEAGQSAVGDIFNWFVARVLDGDASHHDVLTTEAASLRPGQSGLLALDWNNGNRTILVDPELSGLLVGQTLHTSRAEIYRALIEATAFGARAILERLREYGVDTKRIICCGGIAEKNPLLMQIYADVTGCTMSTSGSDQTCALGAALVAAVVGGVHADFAAAQGAMTSLGDRQYEPNGDAKATYDELYSLYRELHDAFGGVRIGIDLSATMKRLIAVRSQACRC